MCLRILLFISYFFTRPGSILSTIRNTRIQGTKCDHNACGLTRLAWPRTCRREDWHRPRTTPTPKHAVPTLPTCTLKLGMPLMQRLIIARRRGAPLQPHEASRTALQSSRGVAGRPNSHTRRRGRPCSQLEDEGHATAAFG